MEARAAFKEAAELMDYDKRGLKTMWAQFWASHQVSSRLVVDGRCHFRWSLNDGVTCTFLFFLHVQRFFKYLCIASKVDKAIELAKTAIKDGKVGLQSS